MAPLQVQVSSEESTTVVSSIFSGEFVLDRFFKFRNGGTPILLRSIYIATVIYIPLIAVRDLLDPTRAVVFDATRVAEIVHETIPWFGTLFAAAYAALYARFASQWTYLAGVYNQFMAAGTRLNRDDADATQYMACWQAGFIEDAETLHLACKPLFASVIADLIVITDDDDESTATEKNLVRETYIASTPGGAVRLTILEDRITEAIKQDAKRYLAVSR